MNNGLKLKPLLHALLALELCLPVIGTGATNHPAAVVENKTSASSAPTPQSQFRVVDANTLAIGLVKVHKRERMLSLPATVNMDHFAIEYALVTMSGKTHESLLATEASPQHIHIAALLLGVVPEPGLGLTNQAASVPATAGVTVEVLWKADGKEQRQPLQRLIGVADSAEAKISATLTNGQWLYTGSRLESGRFVADSEGSIISIIRDSLALINNPDVSRDNDDIHFPNRSLLPPAGTKVTVRIRTSQPARDH